MKNFKILISEEEIKQRIKELGETITKDYDGKSPIVICMLKGAVVFFADLIREIKVPLTTEFVRLSSYKNGTKSGVLEIINNINVNVSGKDILIVEDIIDSGKTLAFFVDSLKKQNPSSIKICTFLNKPENRINEVNVDYVGFTKNYGFVIGYGLDYAERFRELPYLAEIDSASDLI